MNGYRSEQGRRSTWRRWAALAVTATVTAGLTLGVATPSQAAPKRATSVSLTAVKHVATKTNPGAAVVSGDKADLRGTTSANLVGKRLTAQVRTGTTWSSASGSGTVSANRTFSIRIRIQASSTGKETYRVVFAGSATLKASSGSRTATVWTWTPLVDLPVASTDGSSDVNAAAHPQTSLVVAGKRYGSLLAGDVPAGGTGVAGFALAKHCRTFRATLGLTDSSPAGSTIAFSVYFGDVAQVAPTVKRGATKKLDLGLKKVSQLVLRNTQPDPAGAYPVPVVASWPGAKVLCDVLF